MSKQIREMSQEEIESADTLGLDDTFLFSCKACGKCCKHREDIVLTPYDVYRLAGYLGRRPEEIIERYCEVYEGHSSHIPVVWLKPVPPDNSCPFLRNRRCFVHAAKPVLCRVFPLARIMGGVKGGIRYYFNGSSCRGEPKSVTVRDWLADVASKESEAAGLAWTDALQQVAPVIQPDELNCGADQRREILNAVFVLLYLPYETDKPFANQIKNNVDQLRLYLLEEYNVKVPTLEEVEEQMKGEGNGA